MRSNKGLGKAAARKLREAKKEERNKETSPYHVRKAIMQSRALKPGRTWDTYADVSPRQYSVSDFLQWHSEYHTMAMKPKKTVVSEDELNYALDHIKNPPARVRRKMLVILKDDIQKMESHGFERGVDKSNK